MTDIVLSSELTAYYADRRLLWKNVILVLLLNIGWGICFTVVNPLIQLRLSKAGVSDSGIGLIASINSWSYSYLVMYFAWKSDHTVSRWGRRIPYLFLTAPVIILSVILFPLFEQKWILIILAMAQMLFMDIKAATIPLLNIDCVPRRILAQVNSLGAIVGAATGFLAMRYGMRLADAWEYAPYAFGGGILLCTTLLGGFLIKEPPVKCPTNERFKPWSAMAVAWKDKRAILLMIGVGSVNLFGIAYGGWIWLYAGHTLNLSRSDTGSAMSWSILVPLVLSYPIGYLTDRFGSYPMAIVYFLVSVLAAGWSLLYLNNYSGLLVGSLLVGALGPLYSAIDILVYREADAKHIGSVTSTNSCLRGFIAGLSSLGCGALITHFGGNYRIAFVLGIAGTTFGFAFLMLYAYIRYGRRKQREAAREQDPPILEPALQECATDEQAV